MRCAAEKALKSKAGSTQRVLEGYAELIAVALVNVTITTDATATKTPVYINQHTIFRRKELKKQVSKLGEDAKVAIRNIRRDAMDKSKEMKLTPVFGELQYAPMVEESPVSIECKVTNVMELGTHDMFMAEVIAVHVDERYMDEKGTFHLEQAKPLVYSHGQYYGVGKHIGGFGYAVRKKTAKKVSNNKKKQK